MHEDDDFPDHLHDIADMEDVEGIEKMSLTSVGIDIGSSTSHLVFSRLVLRRRGAGLSTQFEVTERAVLYRSPILLTPYKSPTLIDVDRLEAFFDGAYRLAGYTPEAVDTGAVVITGEALNKDNARPIVELFARHSGTFICASAGPNHEALLAAYGSGAVDLSKRMRATVLNVDVGGGTSKLSLIEDGVVLSTVAVSVGARLVAFDTGGVVTRIEEPARWMTRRLGFELTVGRPISAEQQQQLTALMVDVLFAVMDGDLTSDLTRPLMVTEPLAEPPRQFGYLVFSGGVSEYVYERESASYGDLGAALGAGIRRRLEEIGRLGSLRPPAEGIRATVIGAGEYTVQASGVTSYLSDVGVLPAFGLKVVRVAIQRNGSASQAFAQALRKFDRDRLGEGMALALSIEDEPDYAALRQLAETLADLAGEGDDSPLFLILDADVAKSLGTILTHELDLRRPVIAVDGIKLGDLDYVDIGRPMGISESLPVTIKSLMFPTTGVGRLGGVPCGDTVRPT